MIALLAIAATHLRRTTRSRVFSACLLLAAVLAAVVLEPVIAIRTRGSTAVAAAVAWQIISIFSGGGFVLAVVLGVWSIQSETRDKTWQALLCKPVRPWQIVCGKFLGVMAVMGGLTFIVWACVHVLMAVSLGRYFPRLDLALASGLLGFTIPAALAICLSLRVHPIASALIALLLRFDALDSLFDAITSSQLPPSVLFVPAALAGAIRAIAPPYEIFNLSATLGSAAAILWGRHLWIGSYASAVVALLLASATFVLKHRELAKAN
jgi:ABC-type transport system involved in multi-copper enzyme maturation permease subunit